MRDPRDYYRWIGSWIDRDLRVDEVAGVGGFGIVYKGWHRGFEAPIAIKCLRLTGASPESLEQALKREAQLLYSLARLTPHIVQPHHVGVARAPSGDFSPYVVLEWLDGETLGEERRRRADLSIPPRSLAEAIELLTPAAEALGLAHREGIAHRDVKPANLFLVRKGDATMIKVLDFGVAKVIEKTMSLTQAQLQTGPNPDPFTPQYAAPEQQSPSHGATGPWTDVFAMALVLIEEVTGVRALSGDSPPELYQAAIHPTMRPSFRAAGAIVPDAIEAVIAKAVQVDSRSRYRSLAEMWIDLLAAHNGTPRLLARPERSSPVPVASSSSEPTLEENRYCTVLFADTSPLASLSEHLDAERGRNLMERCFQSFSAEIEKVGGHVEEMVPRSIKAIFGFPKAHDNDAERAVRAALAMQRSLEDNLRPQRKLLKSSLTLRVGISTGSVLAGPVRGAPSRIATFGNAVNTAARLQEMGPPGAILVGSDTRQYVVGLFNVAEIPLLQRENGAAPISAYRITGSTTVRHPIPPTDFYGLDTKLVGRTDLLQQVIDSLETSVSEKRSSLITLVGPAGVGRTRILSELVAHLALQTTPFFLMIGQASSLLTDTSYAFAADLIRARFSISEKDAAELIDEKLHKGIVDFLAFSAPRESSPVTPPGGSPTSTALPPRAPAPEELRKGLEDAYLQVATILGAKRALTLAPGSLAPDDRGNQAKNRITAAIERLLRVVGTFAPVVIVCDDAQWADDASLDLLTDLVTRLEDTPLFIVCAARRELFEARPHWGEGMSSHVRIDVPELTRRQIEEMVRDRLRKISDLPADLVRRVVDRAEGFPLTAEELLRLLVDKGVIEQRSPDTWVVHTDRQAPPDMPNKIEIIAQGRIDKLDQDAREVLCRAAVFGRTFWEGGVAHLRTASGVQEPGAVRRDVPTGRPTAELLRQLRDKQLVRIRESSTFDAERELVFAESTIRDVAYRTLPGALQRRLDILAAEWLADRLPGESAAAIVASHYERGEDDRRAAHEYSRAAAHAASLGQNAEALRHFQKALEILDKSEDPDSDPREGDVSSLEEATERRVASWRARVDLRLELGDIQRREGKLEEAGVTYEQARSRILRAERRAGESLDPRECDRWDARVDYRLSLGERRGASVTARGQARFFIERAIERATRAGAPEETPPMWAELAAIHRRSGDFDASRAAALSGLRACRKGKRDRRWKEAVAALLGALSGMLTNRKKLVQAERCSRQAVRVLDQSSSLLATCKAYNDLGAVLFARGALSAARDVFSRELAMAEQSGDLHQLAIARNNLAEVELGLREPQTALANAHEAVRRGHQARADADLPDFYRNLGDAQYAMGQLELAIETSIKAFELSEAEAGQNYRNRCAKSLREICDGILAAPSASEELKERARRRHRGE